mmetsp:Transcript_28268/g.56458  ORF Transcript_28268/g.56458 Transcript_28268/m.56458 type:complete len:586 (-) Transcript_28268:45-1802(-)
MTSSYAKSRPLALDIPIRRSSSSLANEDSSSPSSLDQSPAWKKTVATLQSMYGNSPSGKGVRRQSFGDRKVRRALVLTPETEEFAPLGSLDARIGGKDIVSQTKSSDLNSRRRRRSFTHVGQMKKGERDLKMRDDPDVPSLENRNSEFDLADIEKNLENSWMIIEEAEKERRRKNSKELQLELLDADDTSGGNSSEAKDDGIGGSGSDGGDDKAASRRGQRRSFKNSLERNASMAMAVNEAAESTRNDMIGQNPPNVYAVLDFEGEVLLPRKNRSSLRYHAMTNSVGGKIERERSSSARQASNSSQEGSISPKSGVKRRGRLNTIYKKPVQRRRRRSFHGIDKMMDQQINSTKPSKYATSHMKDQVSPTFQYYHVGSEQASPNIPLYSSESPTSGSPGSEFAPSSPIDLSIVDSFMRDEGRSSRFASPQSSPLRKSGGYLRKREGGLGKSDYDNLKKQIDGRAVEEKEFTMDAMMKTDSDEGADDVEDSRSDTHRGAYRKERSTFEVGFLDNMRQSLIIGNEEDDDDLKDLDNFLAEESRGSGPRKGSRHAPLGGLATIVGSPGAGMTQVWGGRNSSVDSLDSSD